MQQWWSRWREVFLRLIAFTTATAALLGFTLPDLKAIDQLPWWRVTFGVVSVVLLIVVFILEIRSVPSHFAFQRSDSKNIKKYMHNWIANGARVVIWTRDMSWAKDKDTEDLLLEKARRGELIICLPSMTALTKRLESEGAEICAYGEVLSSPASRFTITLFERDGSRVAVGRGVGSKHIIDEFDARDHPAFYLAKDLVRLARLASSK